MGGLLACRLPSAWDTSNTKFNSTDSYIPFNTHYTALASWLRVKLHLRLKRTNRKMDKETRPFVCQGRPSHGWTKRNASKKF